MKNYIKLYEEYSNESQFFQTYEQTKEWLDSMEIENYVIDKSLVVHVHNDVDIENKNLHYIPVQFGVVTCSFLCGDNHLISLKGCPKHVGLGFACGGNSIESLEYCPPYIGAYFHCFANPLHSLVFAPIKPTMYGKTRCQEIYNSLGFTTKAHVEALKILDPNPADTIQRLKKYNPVLAKELSLEFGLESEELTNAYNISKNVEGDFY